MADLSSIYAQMLRKPSFTQQLAEQAASTAPTGSPIAAIARALQGGLAGLMERGDQEQAGKEFDAQFGPSAQPVGASPQTMGAALAGKPAPSSNEPRGIRNNNALNIEDSPFTRKMAGYQGSDGRFARFDTPENGLKAADALLENYGRMGINTPSALVGRWAPAADGNPVTSYTQQVAKALGVDPNAQINLLDPATRQKIIPAMGQFENGKPIATAQTVPPGTIPSAPVQTTPGMQTGMQRAAPVIPPEILARARSLYVQGTPEGKAAAAAMLQEYTKPKDQWIPLSDPQQRAAAGIPATDSNQYQRNSVSGEIKPVNPQPFAVNVNAQQESEFKKEAGQLQAKRFNQYVEQGTQARQLASDVQTLGELGKNFQTGKIAQMKAALGPYADALGIKIEGLSDIQAYEAVVNRVAPNLRVPGVGAQSDFELRNFLKSLPYLGNTPEGNALIERTTLAMTQNKMKAAEIGSLALNGEITTKEADKMLRELPDPMTEWRAFNKAQREQGRQTPQQPSGSSDWQDLGNGVKIRRKQ